MPIDENEEAFVKRFIEADKQERYLGFLSKPKTRDKFLNELYHHLAIKGSLATEIAAKHRRPDYIETQLLQRGAGPQAYVFSPSDRFDQKWLPLTEVLEEILSQDLEAIVCCVPGELAFYLSEDCAYILHAPPQKTFPEKQQRRY
jgi:hypothetical protein